MKTLGVDYTEEAIARRIAGSPRPSRQPKRDDRRISLLIDIQNNMKAQESAGFTHWAKINNLKQAAKTLNFLTEHGIATYEDLENKLNEITRESNKVLESMKGIERHMADLSLLMKHTTTYRQLKPVYDSYRKSSDKEKFLRGHESEIILFEAAAREIKKMVIGKLPVFKTMKTEYDALAVQKEVYYEEYQKARKEVMEYGTIKQNVDSLLSVPKEQEKNKFQER